MSLFTDKDGEVKVGTVIFTILATALCLLVGGCWAYPNYNVWERTLAGEAELKQAEWNRQIAIKEADAKKQAASLLADAEVERAKGVAKANAIIGDSLKNNEAYLRYLWIHSLEATAAQGDKVIYVPTEGNLPILEASRLTNPPKTK